MYLGISIRPTVSAAHESVSAIVCECVTLKHGKHVTHDPQESRGFLCETKLSLPMTTEVSRRETG